jgi:putative cofactor-binding repeat protein
VKPVVVQTAAPSFEVELQPIDARDVGEFERVLADFAGAPNGGLIVPVSLAFESVAEGNRFEFDSDSVIDGNDGPCLEYKSRKHRAEFVNGRRIVAVQQHIPTPVTHAYHEQLDLEIAGCLPLREDL